VGEKNNNIKLQKFIPAHILIIQNQSCLSALRAGDVVQGCARPRVAASRQSQPEVPRAGGTGPLSLAQVAPGSANHLSEAAIDRRFGASGGRQTTNRRWGTLRERFLSQALARKSSVLVTRHLPQRATRRFRCAQSARPRHLPVLKYDALVSVLAVGLAASINWQRKEIRPTAIFSTARPRKWSHTDRSLSLLVC